MTPEDRKAIDRLGLLLDAVFCDANHPAMLDWARVATLVKAERTCGTCLHSERRDGASGASLMWCYRYHDRHRAVDDGCLKGWEPKEGSDAVR